MGRSATPSALQADCPINRVAFVWRALPGCDKLGSGRLIAGIGRCRGAAAPPRPIVEVRNGVTAIEFTRWFLALYFLSVAGFYGVRVVALTRGMRRSPVFAGRKGSLHYATHMAFRTFRTAILAVCVTRLFWPPLDHYLVPFDGLWQPPILLLGDGLLLAGFAMVLRIHFYMGQSWRSGSRVGDETRLITTGPFAVSRNPMMLGVIVAQLGLFLALPTLFTLVCLLVGFWAVVKQVSVEERVLQGQFGAAYEAYRAQTPKWLKLTR